MLCRHNQELEQDSAAMSEEKERLRQEADSLAERLEAVMHDKFNPRQSFDADTPIDKTLNFLQSFIAVSNQTCFTLSDVFYYLHVKSVRICYIPLIPQQMHYPRVDISK